MDEVAGAIHKTLDYTQLRGETGIFLNTIF